MKSLDQASPLLKPGQQDKEIMLLVFEIKSEGRFTSELGFEIVDLDKHVVSPPLYSWGSSSEQVIERDESSYQPLP